MSLLFVALLLLILMQVPSILGDERVSAPTRLEKDSAGQQWVLSEWADQSRPYAKGLLERETWYRQKWGESCRGPKNGRRIHQGNTLRYVEQLLPYTCTVTGTHVYLPAVLDRDDLYRQLTSSVAGALQPLRESDGGLRRGLS